MSTPLPARIEAFLFSEGGSLSRKKLASLLSVKQEELAAGVQELAGQLQGRGLMLIETESEIALALTPETAREVAGAFERELGAEVGDAAIEVISILLYKGPSTRAQIDYIRGVNSTSTIRTLVARGLLERINNPNDAREYLYRPTTELLAHLGVGKGEDLPDYDKISSELRRFEETAAKDHGNTPDTTNDGNARE